MLKKLLPVLLVVLGFLSSCTEQKKEDKSGQKNQVNTAMVEKKSTVDVDTLIRVGLVSGKVQAKKKGSDQWKDLKSGKKLHNGDEVITASQSSVEFLLGGGAQISLKENSHLILEHIEDWQQEGEGQSVALNFGNLAFDVKKLVSKRKGFRFKTTTAVASIRGTKGGIGSSGKNTYAYLEEGVLELKQPNSNKTTVIKKNQIAEQEPTGFKVTKAENAKELKAKKQKAKKRTFDPKRKSSVKNLKVPTSLKDGLHQLKILEGDALSGTLKDLESVILQKKSAKEALKNSLGKQKTILKDLSSEKSALKKRVKTRARTEIKKTRKKIQKKLNSSATRVKKKIKKASKRIPKVGSKASKSASKLIDKGVKKVGNLLGK